MEAVTEYFTDTGYFGLTTQFESQHRAEVQQLIEDYFEHVRQGHVTAEQVTNAQAALIGGHVLEMEDNLKRAEWLAQWAFAPDDWVIPDYASVIRAVTPADVQRVLNTYFTPQRRFVGAHQPITTVPRTARLIGVTVGLNLASGPCVKCGSASEAAVAELTNGREGAARLAVHVDVLHSDDEPGMVVRGPVLTFGSGSDMCWLRVTFWVGERAIFEQDVLVQWPSIRNWPQEIDWMVETRSRYGGSFGGESPELMIEVEQTFIEPAIRFEPEEAYGYRLIIGVDTGIAAGELTVSGEGSCMYFFPKLAELQRFARDLKVEARFVRLLDGLDVADFDFETARQARWLDGKGDE